MTILRSADLRWLADENVAACVVERLRAAGVDVVGVDERGLRGRSDRLILETATSERRAVLTQDTDFGTLAVAQGTPCFGVVLVRPGDLLPVELHDLVAGFRDANEY